jgi:hypothetical protein
MTERLWGFLVGLAAFLACLIVYESDALREARRAWVRLKVAHKRRTRREVREGAGR